MNEHPYHNGSHRHLLSTGADAKAADVDAIIVPTARPADTLRHVIGLARHLGTKLVALCSRLSEAGEVRRIATEEGLTDVVPVDVPDASRLPLPDLATSKLLVGTEFERGTDLSLKRNLGLLLARMAGWRRVVFLDDDITVPDAEDLRRAVGLLEHYEVVGLSIEGFPDNSVVCHAHREAGGFQDTFIGGGALAVDPVRTTSFFPDIYNEDWFYLLNNRKLRPVTITGRAEQEPYDPFAHPERARAEELGDVLAEGIYFLLGKNKTVKSAKRVFWKDYLKRRRLFIEDVIQRVRREPETERRTRKLESLAAARDSLGLITPWLCEKYIKAWRKDRSRWRRYVATLHRSGVDEALGRLGLKAAPPEPCLSKRAEADIGSNADCSPVFSIST